MIAGGLFLISLFVYATCYEHHKPVTLVEWEQKCRPGAMALNDCNWCKCGSNYKYSCRARACAEVDVFGHFNDAIAQINVGMEGRGVWRSTDNVCEPGMVYRRSDLLCICTGDGTWPNPVCRDHFRILHRVKQSEHKEPNQQRCTSTRLYLLGCNVCYCPSTGKLDPTMCTKKTCTGEDDILAIKEHEDIEEHDEELSIYATCSTSKRYKFGNKICDCLKNNRLHCVNSTKTQSKNVTSHCGNVEPGEIYTANCNLCVCDEEGYSYCTTKKCLPERRIFSRDPYILHHDLDELLEEKVNTTETCQPGTVQANKCTRCECYVRNDGKTTFACEYKIPRCDWNTVGVFVHGVPLRSETVLSVSNGITQMRSDCVENTAYEHNCYICRCYVDKKGVKHEVCEANPKCETAAVKDLDDMHGYCEPLHVYKKDCNICKCLSDGKTVRCTSNVCEARQSADQEPITIEVVPVTQAGDPCPVGSSYKIDCNVCFCLNNGNAICTTIDCKKSKSN
ncbi:uncharacterized protein LOC128679755 [Plodia interpunctella]|uniref:uncharacterized protein LOC128679755 n=1 Tax=Plodia interpunctella TaxID=58824 RepID=UPI0023681029|nr:uncharacterized protein LOC128679755 [Plodia interpunctella]